MKPSDAETESARQRRRSNNLDDLENAFKEESPLSDSYSTDAASMAASAKDNKKSVASSVLSNDEDEKDPFEDNSSVISNNDSKSNNNNGTSNIDKPRNVTYSSDTEFRNRDFAGFTGLLSREREDSIYVPTNTSRNEYYQRSNRRTIIAAVLILLAVIGLIIGIAAPGVDFSRTRSVEFPTISPSPTIDPLYNQSLYDTDADIEFRRIVNILNDVLISAPIQLGQNCVHLYCNGDGNLEDLDIHDRVVHYLFFEDPIFSNWAKQERFDNIERVVQRYVLTLFAFSTGLEKTLEDDTGLWKWKSRTWGRYDNWLNGEDECSWYGITCEKREAYVQRRDFIDHTLLRENAVPGDLPDRTTEEVMVVTQITMNENGLDGTMMPELFKLRHLERLEMWKAKLQGKLDRGIRLWPSMQKLWLHENENLEGTIPTEIGYLTNLESLFLGENKLNGTIPTEVGNLVKLNTLAVYGNSLEGNIPMEISKLTSLERLFLDQNKFNGTIPVDIGTLNKLTDVRLDDNELTGPLPVQLVGLENLEVLYLSKNSLRGSINNIAVDGWKKLKHFEAYDNDFSGAVPLEFGTLPNLITLDLHSNDFNSVIPPNFCQGNSRELKKLNLASNKYIRGPIPEALGNCDKLETLMLSDNRMTGNLPAFLDNYNNLRTLNLDRNNFSGGIRQGIGGDALERLRLVGNNLGGAISQTLCTRTNFISADCGSGGNTPCQNNCCECCDLECNFQSL